MAAMPGKCSDVFLLQRDRNLRDMPINLVHVIVPAHLLAGESSSGHPRIAEFVDRGSTGSNLGVSS